MTDFEYIWDDESSNTPETFLKEIAYQLKRIADNQ